MIIAIGFFMSVFIIYAPIFVHLTRALSIDPYISLLCDYDIFCAFSKSILLALVSSTVGSAIALINIYSSLYFVSILPILLPEIVTAVIIITIYGGILNEYVLLALLHAILTSSYASLYVRSAYKKLDKQIFEAAQDLGASEIKIFTSITIPMLSKALIESWITGIGISLDDVILVSITECVTLPIEIFSRLKHDGLDISISALSTLSFFISFIIIYFSRKLTKSI